MLQPVDMTKTQEKLMKTIQNIKWHRNHMEETNNGFIDFKKIKEKHLNQL